MSLQGTTGYTSPAVPAGEVHVIRDVDVYGNAGVGGAINFWLTGESGQTIWYKNWSPSQQSAEQWRGRQVIGPGQSWGFHCDAPLDVTVSGYVLGSS